VEVAFGESDVVSPIRCQGNAFPIAPAATRQVSSWVENQSPITLDDYTSSLGIKQVQSLSQQLETFRVEVLTAIRDQLQEFERNRSSQFEHHSDLLTHLLKEELEVLQRKLSGKRD
jgi:hypothetical protein